MTYKAMYHPTYYTKSNNPDSKQYYLEYGVFGGLPAGLLAGAAFGNVSVGIMLGLLGGCGLSALGMALRYKAEQHAS